MEVIHRLLLEMYHIDGDPRGWNSWILVRTIQGTLHVPVANEHNDATRAAAPVLVRSRRRPRAVCDSRHCLYLSFVRPHNNLAGRWRFREQVSAAREQGGGGLASGLSLLAQAGTRCGVDGIFVH